MKPAPVDHLAGRPPRLYTIAEYTTFLTRRLPFIIVGTILSVGVMASVSLALRDVYSASAVIDAGTLGVRRGVDIDVFRNRFNGSGYREAIADFPRGKVTTAWMEFDPPNVFLRVDALDGATAVAAAERLVGHVIAELALIPVFRPDDLLRFPASPDEAAAIQASLQKLEEWVAEEVSDVRAEHARLAEERDRIFEKQRALDSRAAGASVGEWRSLFQRLSTAIKARDLTDRQIRDLETARVGLHTARDTPMSQAAAPMLRGILHVPPQSAEHLVAMVDGLNKVLSNTRAEPIPPVEPAPLIAAPQIPTSPAWPKRTLNLLIASIFGLVGSSFAALLLEREAPGRRTAVPAPTGVSVAG